MKSFEVWPYFKIGGNRAVGRTSARWSDLVRKAVSGSLYYAVHATHDRTL